MVQVVVTRSIQWALALCLASLMRISTLAPPSALGGPSFPC